MNDYVLKYLLEIQEQTLNEKNLAEHRFSVDNPDIDNIIEAFKYICINELASINVTYPPKLTMGLPTDELTASTSSNDSNCSNGEYYLCSHLLEKGEKFIKDNTKD